MKKLTPRNLLLGTALGILVPLGVLGSNLTTPHIFTSGTPIKAAEVNANFAAIQTAVNSKLDVGAAESSGTRLKHVGYRGADGAVIEGYQIFDTVTGTYCNPGRASDGTWRCIPYSAASLNFFSNNTCGVTAQELFGEPYASQTPGWPAQTGKYLTATAGSPDAGYYTAVYAMNPYTGPVWALDTFLGTCVSIAVGAGTTLYTQGAPIPATNFALLTPGIY